MTDQLSLRRRRPRAPANWLLLVSVVAAWSCAVPAQAQDSDTDRVGEYLEQAQLALEAGEYQRAAAEFRRAAELDDNAETARQAAQIAYTFGFNEDALASAERWLELDADSEEALLYVAQLHLRLGNIRPARRYFARLIEASDDPPEQRLLSLIPILSEEDPEDAARLMRRLASPYRKTAYAQYAMAVMELQAGDADEAKDRAERAIELDPEWLRPKLLYARALMLAGEDEAAIDFAARVVGDDPRPDPEARLELAIMYLSAGRDDDALSQVNQVLLEQPSRTDALRMLAIINFRLGNLDAAWSDFQDLLASGRYTMDALYYLARISDRREEYSRAIALYSQVTRGQNAVVSQRRAGGLIAQEGDEESALEHLREFGENHPSHAIDMVVAEAQLLTSVGRHQEALEAYDRAAAYRPDAEGILLGRAELLVRMDRIDDAIAQYREAVKKFPDSAASLNALGYTLADRTTEYDEAARLIWKALRLDPENPAIVDSWGWVLYRQGDNEEALVHLERAYREFPDPEVAAHIVEVLWKLGRSDEALERLEAAEEKDPDHPLLKNIRERAFPEPSE